MRILIINHEFPPVIAGGGIGTYRLAKNLAERHEVEIITSSCKNESKYEERDNFKIYRVPVLGRKEFHIASEVSLVSFFILGLWKATILVRKKKYDVINTHFAIPSGLIGLIISKFFKIPHIPTIIGADIYDPTRSYPWYIRALVRKMIAILLKHADDVVAISGDTKKRAVQLYGIDRKINIICYGIPEIAIPKAQRLHYNLKESDFAIISIGRLVKRKGYQYLFEAIYRLKNSSIKLLIIGEGEEKEKLEILANELRINSQIIFLGFVSEEEKNRYLSLADIFVLPSLHEGQGIVFLEAMYFGLPIITTDNGGQTDFLKENITGFLVPVKNVEKLAEKIRLLLTNEELRKNISDFNREYAKEFCDSNLAQQYENLFERVVDNKK